jgi:hypothetical protein
MERDKLLMVDSVFESKVYVISHTILGNFVVRYGTPAPAFNNHCSMVIGSRMYKYIRTVPRIQ